MRTTIEITDEQRSKLLEAAARRGEKGFSIIIQEALDQYFENESARRERVKRALAVAGSLSAEAADRLEEHTQKLRRSWR